MANESQYYNPIIQSMIAAAQQQQNRAKLLQEAEQFKADKAIREHQLNIEETRAQHEHEHQTGMLDVQKSLAEATMEANRLSRIKQARDLSLGGVNVGAALSSIGGQPIAGIPNSEDLQAQEIKNIRAQAGAQTEGQMSAAAPYKSAEKEQEFDYQKQLHALDAQNRLAEANVHIGSAEHIAKMNADKMESVARINGSYHLMGIRAMHDLGMGDQSGIAKQLVDGIFQGNRDYKAMSPDEKKLVDSYASGTGELSSLPTNQKEYTKKLEALGGIQTLMNQYRDLAVNYSRDSGTKEAIKQGGNKNSKSGLFGGTTGNQIINIPLYGTVQRTQPGSDLQSRLDSMKASGGQLATYFDQQNRKSDAEILRQVTGSFDPKANVKQNLQKLEQHIQQLKGAVQRTFGNMQPDRINKILSDVGISDLGPENKESSGTAYSNIHVSPDGKTKIGQKNGKWYDTQTGEEIRP